MIDKQWECRNCDSPDVVACTNGGPHALYTREIITESCTRTPIAPASKYQGFDQELTGSQRSSCYEAWTIYRDNAEQQDIGYDIGSFRSGFLNGWDAAEQQTAALRTRNEELEAENTRLMKLINTPHTHDWLEAVPLEAAHQLERWPSEHDDGKSPFDWFWLVGYLSQKAAASAVAGDVEKAKHHTISTAACLLNWFRRLAGDDNSMRPGIAEPAAALKSSEAVGE